MLPTKFQGNQPSGSGEDFLRSFTIYGHGSHLSHVTWTKYKHLFPPLPGGQIWNLIETDPVVVEGKCFENVDDGQTMEATIL